MYRRLRLALALLSLIWAGPVLPARGEEGSSRERIELRAWGVPDGFGADVNSQATLEILDAFQKYFGERYPYDVKPVSTTGLVIPGRTMDMIPLMQIAGDIAPDVMYVNFRQSDTYIRNKFLYPLEKYIERCVGAHIKNGHLLELDDYLARLKQAPGYDKELKERVPHQCWVVMRRRCPYPQEGKECPYLKEWGLEQTEHHYHVWCFPEGPLVMGLFYRKDLFADAGLPERVPEDWDEMLRWARKLTNPAVNQYGLSLPMTQLSWGTLSFLYSTGGLIVDQDANGVWRCVFDSEEAVEAYYFVARLFLEPYENEYGRFVGVVDTGESAGGDPIQHAMLFSYLDQRFFHQRDPNQFGFGPVPKGPTGKRGSEFNSRMAGIYAGLADDKKKRDAAWEYIRFFDGPEARLIQTRVFVDNGYGHFVQPVLLRRAGYDEYVRQVPKQWELAFDAAMKGGVPEPYGKNCQLVYRYVSQAIGQIRTDNEVKAAIEAHDEKRAKDRIRQILRTHVRISNEKMLSILPPEEKRKRTIVACIVAVTILTVFTLVFRQVFRFFEADLLQKGRGWMFGRFKWAYILMLPAVGSVALWAYYPLARGTVIAFQDYNVRGFSRFVGLENFANVLFDHAFWYAMWVSLKYGLMFVVFGFWAPIALAFLLTEVPRGKVLYRTIYYMPAVLTGVVVIFLWKGFYGPYGMINQVLNSAIAIVNHLPGVELEEVRKAWLDEPKFALFFCLLPTIWAGMGPGCLIYLAALKTVPEELYEAADIDGAGIWQKIFNVAIPGIKGLILINFIGVMIGMMHAGGGFMLAMTGGGPWTPHGETEVVGLHIFFQAFGYLKFGQATAMAWVLGSMLIGFTVLQLKKLKRMEFRAAGANV